MPTISRRNLLRAGGASALLLGGFGKAPAVLGQGATPAASPVSPELASALEDLRSRLNGTLMLPGDSGYETASAPANGRYLAIRPIAVARVADEDDVVTCIQWCTENGQYPVGRGGGHSYAGLSTTEGLMIDLRRLNHVTIDWREGTATCGGAALNGDFFTATEDGPVFLPGGTCLGVGTGGLTLGGGIGYNAHWAGLTCDHMVSSRIVTAAGEALDIDASTNSDLYWACRGGAGGNFGINTEFTFNLVDVPQQDVSFFRFDYQGADAAAAVLAAFDTLIQDAPPAFNGVAMAEATEVGAGGPREAIHTMSRAAYMGPVEELRELVDPLLKAATPTTQVLQPMTFWDIQRMIASAEPDPHSFGDISRYSDRPIPEDVTAAVVDLLAECPSRSSDANGSFWSLGWVGGDVINGVGRTDTAYVHRNVSTLLRPTTVWPNDAPASVGDELNAWSAAIIDTIAPHTPDESYQNFPNRDIPDPLPKYYGENLDRLIDIKTAVDPDNLFNNPQSIPVR